MSAMGDGEYMKRRVRGEGTTSARKGSEGAKKASREKKKTSDIIATSSPWAVTDRQMERNTVHSTGASTIGKWCTRSASPSSYRSSCLCQKCSIFFLSPSLSSCMSHRQAALAASVLHARRRKMKRRRKKKKKKRHLALFNWRRGPLLSSLSHASKAHNGVWEWVSEWDALYICMNESLDASKKRSDNARDRAKGREWKSRLNQRGKEEGRKNRRPRRRKEHSDDLWEEEKCSHIVSRCK